MQWSGQFQYPKQAEERLKFVVPLTRAIISVLLYMNNTRWPRPAACFWRCPFRFIGAFWLLALLGEHMNVSV